MSGAIVDLNALALAAVRIILGFLFFFQAYDKLFSMGVKEFTATVLAGGKSHKVPRSFITFSIMCSSYIELIGGALLVAGFFLPYVYSFLVLNLLMVALGFSYLRPMWEMNHFFPRLAMLTFLMVMPMAEDIYRLGSLF